MRQVRSRRQNNGRTGSLKIKLWILLIVLIITGIVMFLISPTGQKVIDGTLKVYHTMTAKSHLSLRQVNIEGHQRTTPEEVVRVLPLRQGMPVLDVDLSDIQMRVAELPWVDSVSVERHLPDTIHIRIHEKKCLYSYSFLCLCAYFLTTFAIYYKWEIRLH